MTAEQWGPHAQKAAWQWVPQGRMLWNSIGHMRRRLPSSGIHRAPGLPSSWITGAKAYLAVEASAKGCLVSGGYKGRRLPCSVASSAREQRTPQKANAAGPKGPKAAEQWRPERVKAAEQRDHREKGCRALGGHRG